LLREPEQRATPASEEERPNKTDLPARPAYQSDLLIPIIQGVLFINPIANVAFAAEVGLCAIVGLTSASAALEFREHFQQCYVIKSQSESLDASCNSEED
jgi:hypothetical protein